MRRLMNYEVALIVALTLWAGQAGTRIALAQGQTSSLAAASVDTRHDEVNYDVQLYLIAASDEAGERSKIPQSMDGVIKQLKVALPFSSYRLAATFLNRVIDGGSLEVSGVGGSPLAGPPANPNTPTFFNFRMDDIKVATDINNQSFIRIAKLRFGLKVPVVTATTRNESGAGYPVIQYQDTGISTEMSVREGVPTVVGTLAASQPNESFVLVVNVKRSPTR